MLGFKFVKEQTPELCLAAVKNYGRVFKYVKEQTPEICSDNNMDMLDCNTS